MALSEAATQSLIPRTILVLSRPNPNQILIIQRQFLEARIDPDGFTQKFFCLLHLTPFCDIAGEVVENQFIPT